jgi:hypothetical protein
MFQRVGQAWWGTGGVRDENDGIFAAKVGGDINALGGQGGHPALLQQFTSGDNSPHSSSIALDGPARRHRQP